MISLSFPALRQWSVRLLILLSACSGKETPGPVYQVPDEVEPYIQKFTAEARLRGKDITVSNLVVTFGPTSSGDVCGTCLPGPADPDGQVRIVLSNNPYCWEKISAEDREELVFHELGHCVLGRLGHRTDRLPNGDYASLMNGKETGLYAICQYAIGGSGADCDRRYRRKYYLDELFDENTPPPDWGK
jgi:hypothetical protein